MSSDAPSQHFEIHVGGDVSGQLAAGSDIEQHQLIGAPAAVEVTAQDRAELQRLIQQLSAQVATAAAAAPAELQHAAAERVRELDGALSADVPDLSTLEYVRRWLGKNLPAVAGSVTGLVFHPILGKLVEAAGNALVDEFKRRFGEPPQPQKP